MSYGNLLSALSSLARRSQRSSRSTAFFPAIGCEPTIVVQRARASRPVQTGWLAACLPSFAARWRSSRLADAERSTRDSRADAGAERHVRRQRSAGQLPDMPPTRAETAAGAPSPALPAPGGSDRVGAAQGRGCRRSWSGRASVPYGHNGSSAPSSAWRAAGHRCWSMPGRPGPSGTTGRRPFRPSPAPARHDSRRHGRATPFCLRPHCPRSARLSASALPS